MSVREYIGARYVPVFADPIQWDPTNVYEPLTVVTDQGASYVSRRMVPEGILLNNTDYWVLWADFNAQLQHYIDEVDAFDSRIDALEDGLPVADYTSQSTVSDAIKAVSDVLPASAFDSVNTVDAAIDAVGDVLPASAFDSVNTVQSRFVTVENRISSLETGKHFVVIGDSFSVTGTGVGASDLWHYKLAQMLGLTAHNYAVSGCGFVQGVSNFANQITNAIQDSSYDNNDVSLVIIYGGLNDCYNGSNESAIVSAAESALTMVKTAFPNAKIVLGAVNSFITVWSKAGLTWPTSGGGTITIQHSTRRLEYLIENLCATLPYVLFIPFARMMVAQSSWFKASDKHPNTTGQDAICSIFYRALCGISPHFTNYRYVTHAAAVGSGTGAFMWNSFSFKMYTNALSNWVQDGSQYLVRIPIPYGLDAFIGGDINDTSAPVAITGTQQTSHDNISWVNLSEVSSIPGYTNDDYTQKVVTVVRHTQSTSNALLGGF